MARQQRECISMAVNKQMLLHAARDFGVHAGILKMDDNQ